MEHVKTLKADTHEEIADKVEKFLQDNDLSQNNYVVEYSTAQSTNFFTLLFVAENTTHYAMIIYKKEKEE